MRNDDGREKEEEERQRDWNWTAEERLVIDVLKAVTYWNWQSLKG